ncbi:MAG TPA: 3-hydroxybutyryl-CoA dehydrogenase [Acidobacteriota bacterium]|jgi:3-hydroxybutyryl-CoA dehydrogenase
MKIEKVGVVGFGLMGSGIAQVCATAGLETYSCEVSDELLKKGRSSVEKSLTKLEEKGKLPAGRKDGVLARLHCSTDLGSLSECDLVIEAITENLQAKRELFGRLDSMVNDKAIFASNTSSLSITEMMMATHRPDRFIGMHFFNPVPLMPLVEIVKTLATDVSVIDAAVAFAVKIGKTPIRTSDRAGFIVNRLLVPYLLDAVRALEEGVGTVEDIDDGMKLGCGYPMGPFTLLDFVGLDTTYYVANIMFEEFRERRFAPPSLLKRMVIAGRLGRKSGKGFYDYSSGVPQGDKQRKS